MRSLLLSLALTLLAAPALAQAPTASSPDPTTAATDEEAHQLFEAGRVAFSAGRNEAALRYFQQAYELSHRYELLYNIGQANDRLRRDDDALRAFEQYLAEAPAEIPNRGEVVSRIEVLRTALAAHTAAPPERDDADATDTHDDDHAAAAHDTAPAAGGGDATPGWIVFGVGAALIVGGALTLVFGEMDRATVESPAMGATWPQIMGAYDRAPILEGVGIALLGVGVVGAGVGLALALTSGGSGGSGHASLRLSPMIGGAGLSLTGSF
jgi:tetratricopeptide (TPR) repeat protein